MLDNERYNEAVRSTAKLSKLHPTDLPNLTFQELLEEEYLTRLSLQKLKIYPDNNLHRLPFIDQIIFPSSPISEERRNLPLLIEVAGMPKAGKSTSIKNALREYPILDPVQEITGFAKRQWKKREGNNWNGSGFEISQTILNTAIPDILLGINPDSVIISDRGLVDQFIFAKANFIDGRRYLYQTESSYYGVRKVIDSPISALENMATNPCRSYALILCLTTPKVSLKREGFRFKKGSVMNKYFLTKLYEQYLRFHHDIIETKKDMPYACLDLSGNNFRENQMKFNFAVSEILKYYNK